MMVRRRIEVTCKTGDDEEQLEGAEVSRYHYKVIFKPETIIPDVDRP